MSTPRFLFTARLTADAAGRPRVAWRLVGGNNHELGRSVDTFVDLENCTAAVDELRDNVGRLRVEPLVRHGGSEVAWRLWLDESAVAAASRWYRRVRESEHNLDHFRAAVPVAAVADVLVTPPPRRELFRPEFVIPHVDPSEHVIAGDSPATAANVEGAASPTGALTQDLPTDQVDELTEVS